MIDVSVQPVFCCGTMFVFHAALMVVASVFKSVTFGPAPV
jgi:hypothetical protein